MTGAVWFILVSKSKTFKIGGVNRILNGSLPQTMSVLLDLLGIQSGTESGNCG